MVVIQRGNGKKIIEDMGYNVQTLVTLDIDEHGVNVLSCIDDECK